jgi:hypothetical protein
MRIPMKPPGYNEERFSLGGAAHDLSATISPFSSIDHRRRRSPRVINSIRCVRAVI